MTKRRDGDLATNDLLHTFSQKDKEDTKEKRDKPEKGASEGESKKKASKKEEK